LDVGALECGTHWPHLGPVAYALAASGKEPNALNNNCSGKDACFLCLACVLCDRVHLRQYAKGYVAPRHPVMRAVTEALEATSRPELRKARRAVAGAASP